MQALLLIINMILNIKDVFCLWLWHIIHARKTVATKNLDFIIHDLNFWANNMGPGSLNLKMNDILISGKYLLSSGDSFKPLPA